MLRLREGGILDRLYTKFIPESPLKPATSQLITPDVDDGVELQYIAPILLMYVGGILLAILMLMFERFVASMSA